MNIADIVKSLPKKLIETQLTYVTISGAGKRPDDIISGLPSPTDIGVKASIVRATKAGSILVRKENSSNAAKVIGGKNFKTKAFHPN